MGKYNTCSDCPMFCNDCDDYGKQSSASQAPACDKGDWIINLQKQRDETRREFQEWREKHKANFDSLDARLVEKIKQLDEARETIKRLNRRAQVAEAAVNENLEACQKAGVSFTRELANAGYHCVRRERDEALKALEPFAEYPNRTVSLVAEGVILIGFKGDSSVVGNHFETARKVVRELKDDGE